MFYLSDKTPHVAHTHTHRHTHTHVTHRHTHTYTHTHTQTHTSHTHTHTHIHKYTYPSVTEYFSFLHTPVSSSGPVTPCGGSNLVQNGFI